jgi:DNA-binding transcriptional LysR family regulator
MMMSDPLKRLSWDDLRIVKAIGETGSLAAAAVVLEVNNSTMFRRLAQVEEALGAALFDRRRTGYVETPAGAEVIALAQRLELDIVSVTRRVSGHDQGHAGELRVTTSDSLALHLLTPIVADFKALHPAVRIEVIVGNASLNLARGECDIAIRATDVPPENLFGKKVATIAWAPYGRRRDFTGGWPRPDELRERAWTSYGGPLSNLKAYKLVEAEVPLQNIAYRIDSVAGVAAAVAAGIGVGYLPCMVGELAPDLTRIGPVEPSLSDDLWLLTHPDIRKSGRVYAFMTHCATAIGKQRAFIEGEQGASAAP